uniref:(northern house mosquito) hypothetical protein n=1 Tax=Culex pipiens TaxID=7175 RepID=A0A8D8BHG5_CULPI
MDSRLNSTRSKLKRPRSTRCGSRLRPVSPTSRSTRYSTHRSSTKLDPPSHRHQYLIRSKSFRNRRQSARWPDRNRSATPRSRLRRRSPSNSRRVRPSSPTSSRPSSSNSNNRSSNTCRSLRWNLQDNLLCTTPRSRLNRFTTRSPPRPPTRCT